MTPKMYHRIVDNYQKTLREEHKRNEMEKDVVRKMRRTR